MLGHIKRERFRGKPVGVVYGGDSSERDVSLKTGKAFLNALEQLGYDATGYDLPNDLSKLLEDKPAAVILGLHGGNGENGAVQGLLSVIGVPFTGSGVMASALAMDKARTKALLRDARVPVADGIYVPSRDFRASDASLYLQDVPLPCVVKLNDAGSSVGVWVCREEDAYVEAISAVSEMLSDAPTAGVLFEAFVKGPEYSVGFFDDQFLGAIEIRPEKGFYDYEAKYATNTTQYIPVEDSELSAQLEAIGRTAYRKVGCQGVARVDMMGEPDTLIVLELNTIPGMTATSLIPKMAARLGLTFEDFTEFLLASAHC